MNRNDLVKHCKRLIEEAYQEATEMIVAYLESHPSEPRATLSKEIDPDNWQALEARVRRLQEKRRSEAASGTPPDRQAPKQTIYEARSGLRRIPDPVMDCRFMLSIYIPNPPLSGYTLYARAPEGPPRQRWAGPTTYVPARKAAKAPLVVFTLDHEKGHPADFRCGPSRFLPG